MRSSNDNWTEEMGVFVHQFGMLVMLLGFAGLFYHFKLSVARREPPKFSWSDDNANLVVKSSVRGNFLNISKPSAESESAIDIERLALERIRCLIARGQKISKSLIAKLVKHQQLQVLDLQNAILEDGVIQELEKLENLEVLLLNGCIERLAGRNIPIRGKELRIALPEVRMIVENRILSLQQPISKKQKF